MPKSEWVTGPRSISEFGLRIYFDFRPSGFGFLQRMDLPPPTAKQARLIWTALTGLALATIVALVVGLVWGLGRVLQVLSPVVWPIAVAAVLAYLLDPVVDFFERRRLLFDDRRRRPRH